jgi:RHS repeat-associated protein
MNGHSHHTGVHAKPDAFKIRGAFMAATFCSIVFASGRSRAPRGRFTTIATLIATLLLVGAGRAAAQEVVEYYATDAIGSVRVVFDTNGTVKAQSDYLPFGEEWNASTPGGPLPVQRYTGAQRDAEENFDYFHARNYQTRAGRFDRPDPVFAGLFSPQLWNRYTYALNNPLAFGDPTGLQIVCWESSRGVECTDTSRAGPWMGNGGSPGGGSGGNTGSGSGNGRERECTARTCDGGNGGSPRMPPNTQIDIIETPGMPGGTSTPTTTLSPGDKAHIVLAGLSIAADATVAGSTISWIPDLVSACVSVGQGDLTGAGLSVAAAFPYIGAPAAVTKVARIERHHVFPVQFRRQFQGKINDIEAYGIEVPYAYHKAIHPTWNNMWQSFFDVNPNPSQAEIFNQGVTMIAAFGLQDNPTCRARRR